MAIERNPNDPYQAAPLDQTKLDARRQEDLEIASASEPAVTGGRVAMFAGAIVIALGLVFYGMNSTAVGPNDAVTTAPVATPANQAAPTGSVMPNTEPGTTTGSAPARPATPSMAPEGNGAATPPAR